MITSKPLSTTADMDYLSLMSATSTKPAAETKKEETAIIVPAPAATTTTVTVEAPKAEGRFGKAVSYAKTFFEKGLGTLNPKNIYETSKFVKIGGIAFKGLLTGVELVARAIYTVVVTVIKIVGAIVAAALALTVGAVAVAAFPITVPAYLGYKMNKQLNRIEQGVLSLEQRVTNLENVVYGPKAAKTQEQPTTVKPELVDTKASTAAKPATVVSTAAATAAAATAVVDKKEEEQVEGKKDEKQVHWYSPVASTLSRAYASTKAAAASASAAISTAASRTKAALTRDNGKPIEMEAFTPSLIDVAPITPAPTTSTVVVPAPVATAPASKEDAKKAAIMAQFAHGIHVPAPVAVTSTVAKPTAEDTLAGLVKTAKVQARPTRTAPAALRTFSTQPLIHRDGYTLMTN